MNGSLINKELRAFAVLATLMSAIVAAAVPALAIAASDGGSPCPAHPPSRGIFTTSLPSALNIDIEHETVTLPLYQGRTTRGQPLWYVVTKSSNQTNAANRGVNYAPTIRRCTDGAIRSPTRPTLAVKLATNASRIFLAEARGPTAVT